jgi:hypothetical protein
LLSKSNLQHSHDSRYFLTLAYSLISVDLDLGETERFDVSERLVQSYRPFVAENRQLLDLEGVDAWDSDFGEGFGELGDSILSRFQDAVLQVGLFSVALLEI